MMECQKCFKKYKDKYMNLHHIFPIRFGGTDAEGRLYLCVSCHREIHRLLESKDLIKKENIIEFTNLWLNNKNYISFNEKLPLCLKCKYRMFISEIYSAEVLLLCSQCGYSFKSADWFDFWKKKEIKKISNDNKILGGYVKESDGISDI